MSPHDTKLTAETFDEALSGALTELLRGLGDCIRELRKSPELRKTRALADLEGADGFLQTLALVGDTMPQERLRDAMRNTMKSIQKSFDALPRTIVSQYSETKVEQFSGRLCFLCQIAKILGPDIRMAGSEMVAWIRIDRDDGAASIFTPNSIVTTLNQRGIVFGIDEEKIREIFSSSMYDEEAPVAQGKAPVQGKDGHVEYKVNVEDLGRAPKLLSGGQVSFKNIELYDYVAAGDTLVVRVPPTPGTPGSTITGRILQPLECAEAELPECNNARISDDGTSLLAKIDGAVTRKAGQIVLDPMLKVASDVSYETGNIDSKVTVIVGHDVRSGFVIRSDRDICVNAVVEGARLEAKGNITVKGGIEGGTKAVLEANGNIMAKFISNATVTSLQNVIVESGIVQSCVCAGKRVTVSGRVGEIIGGEIKADEDIVATTIGSDMGVKTVIRLGDRLDELAKLLEEVQNKIERQEDAVDKCRQIIAGLNQQSGDKASLSPEMQKAIDRAKEMMTEAQDNLVDLTAEQDNLQPQYEESLAISRTVRARKTILPGTVIQILGIELAIKKPTGPATVIKYGDELKVFPFRELGE